MGENKTKDQTGAEFLLAEYGELNQEFRRGREAGINRLNFYITVTSSILGGLILLSQISSASADFLQFVTIGLSFFLILLGWSLFRYTIMRDKFTDDNIRALARIRHFFVDQNPSIKNFLSNPIHDEPSMLVTRNASYIRLTVQYILSLLAALILGLVTNLLAGAPVIAIGIGGITFFAVLLFLNLYANRAFRKINESARKKIRFPK